MSTASPEALQALLDRLLGLRAELVDRLAARFDGGVMALLSSVDASAAAVQEEIAARSVAEGGK